MAQVCLLGDDDVSLRQTLLGHETAREALATYDLREPYHNAIALETVSLGAAVALLNDLNWYLVRYVETALVREPSVSDTEWLSRDLATAIRDGDVSPDATGRYLAIYGVERPSGEAVEAPDSAKGSETNGREQDDEMTPRLVEPMYVTRTKGSVPDYDLRDVAETVVVRVTEREFSG